MLATAPPLDKDEFTFGTVPVPRCPPRPVSQSETFDVEILGIKTKVCVLDAIPVVVTYFYILHARYRCSHHIQDGLPLAPSCTTETGNCRIDRGSFARIGLLVDGTFTVFPYVFAFGAELPASARCKDVRLTRFALPVLSMDALAISFLQLV